MRPRQQGVDRGADRQVGQAGAAMEDEGGALDDEREVSPAAVRPQGPDEPSR